MEPGPGSPSRWRVLGPFVGAIAVLLALCIGGFQLLSAVRAFVGGESLWSKSRGAAVSQLRVYADSGAPDAHARFVAALQVPLGDRAGRQALERSPPDLEQARAGFLRGGNHPADVPGMVWLYRVFHDTALMRGAVDAWVEGDALVAELAAAGAALQRTWAQQGAPSAAERQALHARLDGLDARLVEVEKRFSASIGEASRDVVTLLCLASLAVAALCTLAALVYTGRVLRSAEQGRRQLAEAHQRWTLATANDGIGLFEWPLHGEHVLLDARAGALLGLDLGPDGRAVAIEELCALQPADDPQRLRDAFADLAASGTLLKRRWRARHADGSLRHLETTGIVQNDAAGRPARVLGVLRDVSAEVAHAQLGAEKAAAEQVARARMEFLSRLSHELRTPLNAVLGFSQLLLLNRAEPLPAAAQAKVQHIHAAGTHLLRLVDEVLDIGRIDAGQLQLELQPVALQPVLDAALLPVQAERSARGVEIVARLPAGLQVQADPQRLEQVFVNLLSNGCKYNRPGGALTVSARSEGEQVLLDFADEGDGLSPAEIGQLFQPFHRLPRHQATEGSGLGLAIVRQLALQMGGDVTAASAEGRGSVFTLRLRAAGTAPSTASTPP